MIRRSLLKYAAALISMPEILSSAVVASAKAGFRRVRPGEPGWPSDAEWEQLRRAMEGRLVQPQPLLPECESNAAGPACLTSVKNLRNPYYLGDQAAGTQVSGWLDAWKPSLSAYAVVAKNAVDVAAAVKFAGQHRLRVVVKGGGHSYQGTSNAPDSLLVWTRPMQGITLQERFVGKDCGGKMAPTPAVTVEAGAMWMDVYDAVTTQAGRYVQGGGCATVGVAGLIQSGGFGSFSKRFGLAAAGLLEAEIVTADGAIRIVNPCRDPELFWALKGGGGGSFGVVTKVTLQTHELPDVFGGVSNTIKASSDASFRALIRRFVDFYAASLLNPQWGESISFRGDNSMGISLVFQGLTSEDATAIWQPFYSWLADKPTEYSVSEPPEIHGRPARQWWDVEARRKRGSSSVVFDDRPGAPPTHAWWLGDQEQVGAFLEAYDSLWLPASLLADSRRAQFSDAIFASSRHMPVSLHFNKGLAGAPPEVLAAAKATAINPRVIESFALAIVATGSAPRYPGWPGASADDTTGRAKAHAVAAAAAELRKLAPGSGSYVSESNYFNDGWRNEFWGANYARLSRAKEKYDPEGLFFVHHGVGSESWSADGFIKLGDKI